jgi:MarR family transcriptional regulator, organic hydroperoxide resistance regulator
MEYNIVDTIMMLNEQCCHMNLAGEDENGITARELQVMGSLTGGESVSSSDLAKRNILSPSRMSRIIDRLVHRGLLNRETDEEDRRYSKVSLTHEGEIINSKAMEFKTRCESKIKSRLSEREFAVIQKALHLLSFAMENDYGIDTGDSARHN